MVHELGGNAEESFKEALQDQESLTLFLAQMNLFSQRFCEGMMKKSDFTLRLEVRCDSGKMLHTRVYTDDIVRPRGKKKRLP